LYTAGMVQGLMRAMVRKHGPQRAAWLAYAIADAVVEDAMDYDRLQAAIRMAAARGAPRPPA
jgi:AmiR/NasT family two-component response regulator